MAQCLWARRAPPTSVFTTVCHVGLVGDKRVTLKGGDMANDLAGANYECSEVPLSPQASALPTTTASSPPSPSLPPLRPQLPPRPHLKHFWPLLTIICSTLPSLKKKHPNPTFCSAPTSTKPLIQPYLWKSQILQVPVSFLVNFSEKRPSYSFCWEPMMILQETECLFVWDKHFAAPVSLELFQQRESEGTTNLVMFGNKVLFLSFCYPMFVMTINKLDIIWLSNISLHLGQLWLLCQMQG